MSDNTKKRLMLFALVIAAILLILFGSCRSQQVVERSDSRDSVQTEYSESIVYVPVITYVDVPAQTAERETRDSTSHLETAFAQSDAALKWVNGLPFLFHSLANKPQRIEHRDSVPVRNRYFRIRDTHYKTLYKTKILERRLTLYQRAMIYVAPGVILAMLVYIIYLRRRLQRRPDIG